MTLDQLTDTRLEPTTTDRTDLQAEPAQYPADAALDVERLTLHQLARCQQRSHLLSARRLACTGRYQPSLSSWAMPRASRRSVSHTHRRQGRLHVTCLEQHCFEPGFGKTPMQPLRQRACLETDTRNLQLLTAQEADQGFGLARHLHFAQDLAPLVDDARCSVLKRRPIRHNAPRLSSIRLAGRRGTSPETPIHHDRGTATPPAELEVRPITVSFDPFLTVADWRPLPTPRPLALPVLSAADDLAKRFYADAPWHPSG